MARYIDADELLKHKTDHEMISTHLIYNAPTADVKLIVRGEWIYPYETTTMICHCSICGTRGNGKYNYCPHCGAEMRGNNG